MKGYVDDGLRALINVKLGNSSSVPKSTIEVWIDTAFNGGLVLPREVIEHLKL